MDKVSFTSLTPEALETNESIYNSALDEAFNNDSIKNIAITGIYGSGKSTVWETYKKERKLKNVITVSLGKYDDDSCLSESVEKQEDLTTTELGSIKDEVGNNIERQLINQITAQVDNKTIPLSKYQYKDNKSIVRSIIEVILAVFFLASLLFWNYRIDIISKLNNETLKTLFPILVFLMFFVPIAYALWGITKKKRMPFSRIKFGNTEANLEHEPNIDETVLDRDIRELVYILYNSGSGVIVFEDLDRYNHLDIYKKLRELNYLLNSFILSKNKKRIVKFIYMLKDGLFYSKNRTKFFDFIVPIIPIINSRNSEDKLIELFGDSENSPTKRAISNIALYIDDMRLLKNIYNEYNVYFEIIAMDELELNKDKLFALIVLKNVFPNEFDELQQDKGYVYSFIKNKEDIIKLLNDQNELKLEEIKSCIEFLQERSESDKFEFIASHIPSYVRLNSYEKLSWPEKLKQWYKEPERPVNINYLTFVTNSRTDSFNLKRFLEEFVYKNNDIRNLVENFPEDKAEELELLYVKKDDLQTEIRDVDLMSLSELLKKLTTQKRNELFLETDSLIKESHYFPLVKYLLHEGLIDETYWHYKGYFYTNSLGKNDTLFLKNMLEGSKQDILLRLESPNEVYERMTTEDFLRSNILNLDILEQCLLEKSKERTSNMLTSAIRSDALDEFSKMLSIFQKENKINILDKFVEIIFYKNHYSLLHIMRFTEKYDIRLFRSLILSLYSQEKLSEKIEEFRKMLEEHSEVLVLLENKIDDSFFKNLSEYNILFSKLPETKVSKSIIKEIADRNLYKLSVENVHHIVNEHTDVKIKSSSLIQEIFENEDLCSVNSRIEGDFSKFAMEYIDSYYEQRFNNNEKVVFKILNSSLSESYKKQYLDNNNTVLQKISNLENLTKQIEVGILDKLFETNKLEFSSENISFYLENSGEITPEFLKYIEHHISNEIGTNEIENSVVCQSEQLCNKLLSHAEISNDLFDRVVLAADEPLSNIEGNYTENRIEQLLEKKLINVNNSVILYLLNKGYIQALVSIYNGIDIDVTEVILSNNENHAKLKPQDFYTLINNVNSQVDVLRLIEGVDFKLELSKVDLEKETIVKNVLKKNLSKVNIEYMLLNFSKFNFKEEFLSRIQETMNFGDLEYELLKDDFIRFVLKSTLVSDVNKAVLIVNLIKNSSQSDDFIKHLESFEAISDLANVFTGKYPEVDTSLKTQVSDALKERGYVKHREPNRIMLK